jgi:hypothetical protein
LLIGFFAVTWAAALARVDQFPLSWAPMYSVYRYRGTDTLAIVHKDKAFLREHGWLARRRDGGEEWVPLRRLNIPMRSFWRIYYERSFGSGSMNFKHANADAGAFDRWLWRLEPGERTWGVDWSRRLLGSVNHTLGRKPQDPDFIVSLTASRETLRFERSTLRLVSRKRREVELVWNDAWRGDFE